MNKKIAIVYESSDKEMNHTQSMTSLGGTDTNLIQIAEQYSANCDECFFIGSKNSSDEGGVRYRRMDEIVQIFEHNAFDYIILACRCMDAINLIKKTGATKNVYLFHTHYRFGSNSAFESHNILNPSKPKERDMDYILDQEVHDDIVKGFLVLSESMKNDIHKNSRFPLEKIFVVGLGIDPNMFTDDYIDKEIDHTIFWSSNCSRGAFILTDHILPVLRQIIPDAKVRVAQPVYANFEYGKNYNGVEYIGHLSKKELYDEMRKHACWYYPSVFNETFCITALENALCGNELILPIINGPETTLYPFKEVIGMRTRAGDKDFLKESVLRIVDSFQHYHDPDRVKLRKQIYDHIVKTWSVKACVERIDKVNEIAGES